jgi:hypothetical protein
VLTDPVTAPPALIAAGADETAPAPLAASGVSGASVSRARVSVSGAGTRGPGGCVQRSFKVSVRGSGILRVDYLLDGRAMKRVTKRDSSGRYRADVSLTGLARTSHRITARVTFHSRFAPRRRNLPVTFHRCAQIATAPAFAG